MDHTARAYEQRGVLAGVYVSNRNLRGIAAARYHRCWPFLLAMKPFYHLWPSAVERVQYDGVMPLFDQWLRHQRFPPFNVVQAVAWGAKTPFDLAERVGALKVLDAPNSYPTTYDALERRELALWAPGFRPAIPPHVIAQAVRDLDRADLVLCPSVWVQETMLANGVPAAKCVVNPFGVNVTTFRPREHVPARPRFICVGSIRVRKGHQYLFRAFEQVRTKHPTAELICVGELYRDFAAEWERWRGRFTHIAHLPHDRLAETYRQSTAFVLPSTEEGFARVIPEAMASGLPIIATHESGATTVVTHEQEGLIVRNRDPADLAAAINRLIEQPDFAQQLGRGAAQKAQQQNTWQDYGDRCLAAIQSRLQMRTVR